MPVPKHWWSLSYIEKNVRYHRTADNKLELEILEGCLYDTPYIYFARYKKLPLKKDEVIKLSGFQVRILELNQRGPTRIEFTFDRSLDDGSYCFYKYHESRLQIVSPPAPGQSLTL